MRHLAEQFTGRRPMIWISLAILLGAFVVGSMISSALRLRIDEENRAASQLKRVADKLEQVRADHVGFQRVIELEIAAQRRERNAAQSARAQLERERLAQGIKDGTVRIFEG